MVHCFFDEIQEVTNWEPFIGRILRTEKCSVFISGSSAKMLLTEVATHRHGNIYSTIPDYSRLPIKCESGSPQHKKISNQQNILK